MPRAATWSRSRVETPGATAAHTSSRISATARQASRWRRISSLDLYLIRTLPPSIRSSTDAPDAPTARPERSARPGGRAAADARPLGTREALVVAGDEVRLDLLHGVERHADDDEQAGAAEVERHVVLGLQERGQDADRRQIDRAGAGD